MRSPRAAGFSPGSHHFVVLGGKVEDLEPRHLGGLRKEGVVHSLKSPKAPHPPLGIVSDEKGSGEQVGCPPALVGSVALPPAEPSQPKPGP